MQIIIKSITSNLIDTSTNQYKEMQIVSWNIKYTVIMSRTHEITGTITIPEDKKTLLDETYLIGFIKNDFHNFK